MSIDMSILANTPNTITHGDGFFISYNDRDIAIYGCETTALVLGQMAAFYILKGDHTRQYRDLIPQGFDACMSYYKEHMELSHPMSDKMPVG